mmetsp:Transcript_24839/g.49443  ORF Transcript_24839/g.49443 Transcript_24839/m.49443 type:complete len:201 (-) Transcript_24839:1081-1683(-)
MVRSLPFMMLSWTILLCSSSMLSSSSLPILYWSSISCFLSWPVIFVSSSCRNLSACFSFVRSLLAIALFVLLFFSIAFLNPTTSLHAVFTVEGAWFSMNSSLITSSSSLGLLNPSSPDPSLCMPVFFRVPTLGVWPLASFHSAMRICLLPTSMELLTFWSSSSIKLLRSCIFSLKLSTIFTLASSITASPGVPRALGCPS